MNSRTILRLPAMIAATLIACAAFTAGPSRASAACPSIVVVNNTTCHIWLWIRFRAVTIHLHIAAGASVTFDPPVNTPPDGVVDQCGTLFPIPGGGGCTSSFRAAGNCCAVACWDPINCIIAVNPAPNNCPC